MPLNKLDPEKARSSSLGSVTAHLQTVFSWLQKPKNLWLVVFIYILLAGLFVQLVILPYIIPTWHAGNGLLKELDAVRFHQIALKRAKLIHAFGWNQWELLASRQLVSGVASLFYVLITPAPWTLLPLNAALHATASLCIYFILLRITKDPKNSLIATTPFVFFPSNFMWNTQLLNENYAVPGIALLLYGWSILACFGENSSKLKFSESILALVAISFGCLLFGLVRIEVFAGLAYLFIPGGVWGILYWAAHKTDLKIKIANILFLIIAISIMLGAARYLKEMQQQDYPVDLVQPEEWQNTPWLPEIIDQQLKDIANYRGKFIRSWADAGSNIDEGVALKNLDDLINYIPRAAEIAFLAPFPNMWFTQGVKTGGTAMRLVAAFEMIIVYLCLVGLPLFLWKFSRQPALWIILFICVGMLLVYALTVPNVGSLYRFRYPYLMPVVCFGLAGWLDRAQKKDQCIQ